MNQITRDFIKTYEADHPEVIRMYCELNRLYDADLDMFHIEEINDEYQEFKRGSHE
ncbi:hypothetical protein ACX1NX_03030 [Acinetobacter sp. ANC 5383]